MIKIKNILPITILFLAYLLNSSAWASVQDSVGVSHVKKMVCIKYLVQPKETLYGIAKKHNLPVAELIKYNPSLKNKSLKVGQFVYIPTDKAVVPAQTSDSQGNKKHLVAKGDTYYSIARKAKVSVNDLMVWNENKPLKEGQIIFLQSPSKRVENVYTPQNTENTSSSQTMTASTISLVTEIDTEESNVNSEKYTSAGELKVNKEMEQVLVVPFYPNLYFSDVDEKVTANAGISSSELRETFRVELSKSIQPVSYEAFYLLGGGLKNTEKDLEKIYRAVGYTYEKVLNKNGSSTSYTSTSWSAPSKKKTKFEKTYYATQVKDATIFPFLEKKYSADYVVFINQVELIKAVRNGNTTKKFVAHYSIFDKQGNKVAGNKCEVLCLVDTDNMNTIMRECFPRVGRQIADDLPSPAY
ncbi:MAG: LysM peptidoglycan-binding domain-containing protein [Cytophagales bacterium]|nr:LysM peptidoglycan-binding domain-containing protein [Cytophagales bacterium]